MFAKKQKYTGHHCHTSAYNDKANLPGNRRNNRSVSLESAKNMAFELVDNIKDF